MLALLCVTLLGIHPAPGTDVRAAGGGNLHVHPDLVVKAQVFVDVVRSSLACRNGPDDRGGTGNAVAAGEHALHLRQAGAGVRQQGTAPLDLDAGLLKALGLDALADGYNDKVRRDADRLHRSGVGPGTARLVDLADDLGLGPQGHGPAVLGLHPDRGMEGQHLGALGNGALHLLRLGGHILLAAAVDAGDLFGPQADGAAGDVHGHVAAADDRHVHAGEVRHFVVADVAQHIHGGHDAHGVLAFDAHLLIRVGADAEVQSVILVAQVLQGDVGAHVHLRVDLNAQGEDGRDLAVQLFPGEAVIGDAVAHHAAQALPLFINGGLVAHEGQVVGCRQAAGAAAHDGHPLAGGLCGGGLGHFSGPVHGSPFQTPDVDTVVHHVPAAAGLAGMLADVGAGGGKGVVLPHQAHGVVIAAGVHQGDVAGDIHTGGAHSHAGNGVVEGAEAAVVQDVLLKVLPEAPDAGEDQVGGVDADGAVRRVHDDLGGLLQVPQHPHIRLAVQNF